MNSTAKFRLAMHLLVQLLAQGAVATLIPVGAAKYYAALVAVVGVVTAFADQSVTTL